jgi:FixJ family two-component response regulator
MKSVRRGDAVFVIDNNASIRSALKEMFQSVRLEAKTYALVLPYWRTRSPRPRARAGCEAAQYRRLK